MIVDSHQHFWDPSIADYPWMTGELAPLRQRFGPEDLEPLLREHGVTGTVVVQARHSLDETQDAARDRGGDALRPRRRRLDRPHRRRRTTACRSRRHAGRGQASGARRARPGLASARRCTARARGGRRRRARLRPARANARAARRGRDGKAPPGAPLRARPCRQGAALAIVTPGREGVSDARRVPERDLQALRPVHRGRPRRDGRARAGLVRLRSLHVRIGLAGVPDRYPNTRTRSQSSATTRTFWPGPQSEHTASRILTKPNDPVLTKTNDPPRSDPLSFPLSPKSRRLRPPDTHVFSSHEIQEAQETSRAVVTERQARAVPADRSGERGTSLLPLPPANPDHAVFGVTERRRSRPDQPWDTRPYWF